jgi:hypothetical protein
MLRCSFSDKFSVDVRISAQYGTFRNDFWALYDIPYVIKMAS